MDQLYIYICQYINQIRVWNDVLPLGLHSSGLSPLLFPEIVCWISRCLYSDYIPSENSPLIYFSCTGHCMHFLKCVVPLPLNSSIFFPPASSDQLWSPAHCPYSRSIGLHAKTQPNIFDLRVFRCIFSPVDGKQFGYLGVCMEIRVAHIVIDSIMCKTVLHTF